MSEDVPITIEKVGDVSVARVHLSELTSQCADMMLNEFGRAQEGNKPPRLAVDLSSVKFIDSVALGTLVLLLRRINQAGGKLALVGLTGHPRKMLEVTGLEKVFQFYDDVSSAVAQLQGVPS